MKKQKIARLVPPQMDKNWSFQMINVTEDDAQNVYHAFATPVVQAAHPFLQGNSGGWLMVEFWTRDKVAIDAASQNLADLFGLTLREGDFTRDELGLS